MVCLSVESMLRLNLIIGLGMGLGIGYLLWN